MSAAVERVRMPLVTCAPWCADGDGHPDEFCRADQWCGSAEERVEPLVSEYRFTDDEAARFGLPTGYRVPDGYAVAARRVPGHLDMVCLTQMGPDTETVLTPTEARRLAAALLNVADVIEAGR